MNAWIHGVSILMQDGSRQISSYEAMRQGVWMAIVEVELIARIQDAAVIIGNNIRDQMDSYLPFPKPVQYRRKKSKKILLAEHVVPEDHMELARRITHGCRIPGLAHDVEKQFNVLA